MKPIIYYLLAAFLMVTACKNNSVNSTGTDTDPDPDIENPPQAVTLEGQEGTPFELVTIDFESGGLSEESYTASFEGEDLELVRVSDVELSFIVPDVDPGTYPVEFDIAGTSYSMDVSVLEAAEIEDAGTYVEAYVAEVTADPAFTGHAELEEAMEEFRQLPEEDQLVAARFINSNRAALDALEQEIRAYDNPEAVAGVLNGQGKWKDGECDFYCKAAQLTKIAAAGLLLPKATATVGAVTAVAIGIDVGLSIITGRRSYLLQKVKEVAVEILSWAYFPQIKLATLTFSNPSYNELLLELKNSDAKRKSGDLELKEKVQYKLYVDNIQFRSVQEEDKNSSDEVIRTLVTTYDIIRATAEEYFDFTLPAYSNVIEEKAIERLDQLTLSVAGDGVEIKELTTKEDHFLVSFTFTEEKVTEPREFSLQVGYEKDAFSFEDVLSVTLEPSTGIFTDPRDGKTYRITELNGTEWFLDDLAYNKTSVKNYRFSESADACPAGWRVPSKEDFLDLFNFLGLTLNENGEYVHGSVFMQALEVNELPIGDSGGGSSGPWWTRTTVTGVAGWLLTSSKSGNEQYPFWYVTFNDGSNDYPGYNGYSKPGFEHGGSVKLGYGFTDYSSMACRCIR